MEIVECIKNRRSVRFYSDQKIAPQVWEKIVDLARFAPSWKNTQTPEYIVVDDSSLKEQIGSDCVMGFTHNTGIIHRCAALVLLTYREKVCGYEADGSFTTKKGAGWEMFDAGLACQTFCLAAHSLGVGSVILGIFDEEAIKQCLKLPQGRRIAALVSCGYPEDKVLKAPPRKSVSELLSFAEKA